MMNRWARVSSREWELINPYGEVIAVVEETRPGWWEWDGLYSDDAGIESTCAVAMMKVEERYNVSVH